MAMGGDQGGSIRIPSAACGIEANIRPSTLYGNGTYKSLTGSYGTYGKDRLGCSFALRGKVAVFNILF